MTDFVDELERLRQLRLDGVLTDDEFVRAKDKLLGASPSSLGPDPAPGLYWDVERVRRVIPLDKLGSGPSSGFDWTEIDALLRQNKMIQAIKVYRTLTGKGLAEAKHAVEHRKATFR